MFNLDLELDFDDDFSSNLFAKQLDKIPKTSSQQIKSPNQNNSLNLKSVSKPQTNQERLNNEAHNQKLKNVTASSNSFFNFPLSKESSHFPTSLKRPCLDDDRPQKKKLLHESLLQRKFPGPAGLLPDKPFKEIEDIAHIHNKYPEEDEGCKNEPVIYSQSSGSVFLESAYQKLVLDFDLNEPNNPLNKYTVEWVKKSAMNKTLYGRKIPFLSVVLHSIDHSTPDPVLLLRDPTGEINGTLHREVWVDMAGKLRTGIGLALRQVGVLITGVIRRQVYLNITMNNILALYNPSENDSDVEITTINKLSRSELYQSVKRWQAQAPPHPAPSFPDKTSTPPLFNTILDSPETPRPDNEEIENLRNKLQDFVKQNTSNSSGKSRRGKLPGENSGSGVAFSDFTDDVKFPQNNSTTPGTNERKPGKPSQVLSQAESLIFEEVLSGINLDEFEM